MHSAQKFSLHWVATYPSPSKHKPAEFTRCSPFPFLTAASVSSLIDGAVVDDTNRNNASSLERWTE